MKPITITKYGKHDFIYKVQAILPELTDISSNQLPDKHMSKYDPPHAEDSYAIDGGNGAWFDCRVHNEARVLNQWKALDELN